MHRRARKQLVSKHAFLRVICREDTKTVRRPSDRVVNWRPHVQGKSLSMQVIKNPTFDNLNGCLWAFKLQSWRVQSASVHKNPGRFALSCFVFILGVDSFALMW